MTETVLDRIKAYKLEEVAADKAAKPLAEVEAEARRAGMLTMVEDGIFKAAQGVTTIEEVLRVISE